MKEGRFKIDTGDSPGNFRIDQNICDLTGFLSGGGVKRHRGNSGLPAYPHCHVSETCICFGVWEIVGKPLAVDPGNQMLGYSMVFL